MTGKSQLMFEQCRDLAIAADRHQVDTVERAAVADGQNLITRGGPFLDTMPRPVVHTSTSRPTPTDPVEDPKSVRC